MLSCSATAVVGKPQVCKDEAITRASDVAVPDFEAKSDAGCITIYKETFFLLLITRIMSPIP